MAGNKPVPQGVELKLIWTYLGNPYALNILHCTHAVGVTMDQARATAIDATVKTQLTGSLHAASLNTGVALQRVEVRHMDNASDPWWAGNNAPVAGTSAGNPLPAATAFVATLKTGLRGRSFNGRVYLWGFTEDVNDAAGGITAAGSTAAINFLLQTRAALITTYSMPLVVLSRFTTPAGSPPGTAPTERTPPLTTEVQEIIARDQRWDVQRRRATPGV